MVSPALLGLRVYVALLDPHLLTALISTQPTALLYDFCLRLCAARSIYQGLTMNHVFFSNLKLVFQVNTFLFCFCK